MRAGKSVRRQLSVADATGHVCFEGHRARSREQISGGIHEVGAVDTIAPPFFSGCAGSRRGAGARGTARGGRWSSGPLVCWSRWACAARCRARVHLSTVTPRAVKSGALPAPFAGLGPRWRCWTSGCRRCVARGRLPEPSPSPAARSVPTVDRGCRAPTSLVARSSGAGGPVTVVAPRVRRMPARRRSGARVSWPVRRRLCSSVRRRRAAVLRSVRWRAIGHARPHARRSLDTASGLDVGPRGPRFFWAASRFRLAAVAAPIRWLCSRAGRDSRARRKRDGAARVFFVRPLCSRRIFRDRAMARVRLPRPVKRPAPPTLC